ncbi:MAG: VWA domain-containing protein, partial [Pseudomonadota bacterium]|nr:VWA domain-containing protein [Pseudomonadota bacterium]
MYLLTIPTALLMLLACQQAQFSAPTKAPQVGSDHHVRNGKPLQLKTTSDAQEVVNLSSPERQSTITITADTERSYRTIAAASNANGSVRQTGKVASTRVDSRDAIIDIAIVVDESESITKETLMAVAKELSAKLTTKLTGSDWKIAVTGSSKGSEYLEALSSKSIDDHADKLNEYLVGVRQTGTNYNNELMIDNAVKLVNNPRWQRNNADAQVVLLITDEDLQCVRNNRHVGTGTTCENKDNRESERLSKNWKAKDNTRSVFGIIKDTDDTRQNYLSTCDNGNNSCYKSVNNVYKPNNGNGHLFDLIASIGANDF